MAHHADAFIIVIYAGINFGGGFGLRFTFVFGGGISHPVTSSTSVTGPNSGTGVDLNEETVVMPAIISSGETSTDKRGTMK
jgi:hypothetical protein